MESLIEGVFPLLVDFAHFLLEGKSLSLAGLDGSLKLLESLFVLQSFSIVLERSLVLQSIGGGLSLEFKLGKFIISDSEFFDQGNQIVSSLEDILLEVINLFGEVSFNLTFLIAD